MDNKMDVYSSFMSSSMQDISLADTLHDLKSLTPEELTLNIKALRKYSHVVGQFVERSHTTSCANFSYSNWDQHFEEELNSVIHSIPLETFNARQYPVDKLVCAGWAVLAVYRLDVENNKRFLASIARKLLNEKLTKTSTEFLKKLCAIKDELLLPASLYEDIVTTSPAYVEDLLVDLLRASNDKRTSNKVLLQRPDVSSWLNACSRSSTTFQIFASIINTLLVRSRGDPRIATFALDFQRAVRKLLPEKSSVAVLYPRHLQTLVLRLDRRTQPIGDERRAILEPLMDGLTHHRDTFLCLLSHFPQWIPTVLQFATATGETRVFSNRFLQEDCCPQHRRLVTSREVRNKCELLIQYDETH